MTSRDDDDNVKDNDAAASLPPDVLAYYQSGDEAGRLERGIGPLERARMHELLSRFLPAPPAVVYDIGGGPGAYAIWMAGRGYHVHLIDAVEHHLRQARAAAAAAQGCALASAVVGDARRIVAPDASADAVLMHGPLYHLTERDDRLAALREARRLLRADAVLLAVAIPRHASAIVGIVRGWITHADYLAMVRRELHDGQHRRPDRWPDLFATAFFHDPRELAAELIDAGFAHAGTYAIQGPAWLATNFAERWANAADRAALLEVVRLLETDAGAIGTSPHILAVARACRPA